METEMDATQPASRGGGEESWDEEDGAVLRFLDSVDNYLTLFDSLSSTLRQGWLDLACARHSMGSSRISTALFDLKEHPAASVVQVNESTAATGETTGTEPHFALLKYGKVEDSEGLHKQSNYLNLRHRGLRGVQETHDTNNGSPTSVDDKVQKERSKALSVFGALVSPKLRSTQASFETVLETLIDIANTRSMMLAAFNQLQQRKEGSN